MAIKAIDKIRNAIYGLKCIKCTSTNILVLLDRKYHCQNCSNQISPKELGDRLNLIYSYYKGRSINQVAKDLQFNNIKIEEYRSFDWLFLINT